MKVLICDHADCMMPDHALEIETLRAGLGEDVEVEVLEYEDDKRDEFYEHVADADALLTAFVTVDAEAMDRAPKLKVVSLNSTGFDQVDLDEATKRGIGVCPVGEYCTWGTSGITPRHPSGRVWRIRCWASLGSARSANARPRRRWAS